MPHIDKHPPGEFCWVELATTDQDAAKKFYTSLFGWTIQDSPMGPEGVYTVFKLEGRDAAAAYGLRPDQLSRGVPTHWGLYIEVLSADDSAKRAAEFGAKVLMPPFDVFDLGRMAVLHDPGGAVFSIWQSKKSTGIGIAGIDGTFCWADLNTPDPERAGKFYSDLFGWKIEGGKDSGYLHIKNGEKYIGGIPPAEHRQPESPPHWLLYFAVSDCAAIANKAKGLGAAIYLEPMTMENVGTMAILADPQGAVFAIFKSK